MGSCGAFRGTGSCNWWRREPTACSETWPWNWLHCTEVAGNQRLCKAMSWRCSDRVVEAKDSSPLPNGPVAAWWGAASSPTLASPTLGTSGILGQVQSVVCLQVMVGSKLAALGWRCPVVVRTALITKQQSSNVPATRRQAPMIKDAVGPYLESSTIKLGNSHQGVGSTTGEQGTVRCRSIDVQYPNATKLNNIQTEGYPAITLDQS